MLGTVNTIPQVSQIAGGWACCKGGSLRCAKRDVQGDLADPRALHDRAHDRRYVE
jgi:hypothetical protein